MKLIIRQCSTILVILTLLLSGCSQPATIIAPQQNNPPISTSTVYITDSGTKYHRIGCRYLSKSSIPIDRATAINEAYTPCKVCSP